MVTDEPRQRAPRLLDPGYLAWLRKQPCACGCGRPAPSDAAHLKSGSIKYGKPSAGTARPDDMWAVPLHHGCHMRQHDYGDEIGWWYQHLVHDVFVLARRYFERYRRENPGANPGYYRRQRSIKPRKPRAQRAKIRSRNTLRRNP